MQVLIKILVSAATFIIWHEQRKINKTTCGFTWFLALRRMTKIMEKGIRLTQRITKSNYCNEWRSIKRMAWCEYPANSISTINDDINFSRVLGTCMLNLVPYDYQINLPSFSLKERLMCASYICRREQKKTFMKSAFIFFVVFMLHTVNYQVSL